MVPLVGSSPRTPLIFEKWTEGNVEADKKYFGLASVASTLQQGRDGNSDAAEPGTDPKNDVVDLPTMTTGALNVLGQNDKGFSVMIEGGAIDWSGHSNQTGRDIEETQDFNKAVDAAIAWVKENSSWDETLLIVTADHETGYLSGKEETESWNPQTGEKETSSAVGAGFLGAGVVAALLGAIAAFLQSVGVVKVDFSALQKMFR
ncbi:alkaline phosphatase [Corynebacterium minutissimum]|uniref:alkaline phosphatase n=1 Tax=Corynebacterium minutissimum TaxID=38301 RepID=UPI001EF32194|nr:alkaline phosphatase [Corynebacterium minutissimum]MCG7228641.1 alkaline phosphatase [Corynebacterium minutissimum]MCG7237758.1 alkaline phosphatase [Corynebacterium minutissimum]